MPAHKFEFDLKMRILIYFAYPFNYTVYRTNVKLRIQIETTRNHDIHLINTGFFKFPDFSLIFIKFSNSLIFPCREFFIIIFPVFPVFPSPWPPCADQLRGNREADQCLCFRYSDSTIPLLLKSEISSF